MIKLTTPITYDKIKDLKKGDPILLTGTIFTARDAAHKKMTEEFAVSGVLPLKGEVIYYDSGSLDEASLKELIDEVLK